MKKMLAVFVLCIVFGMAACAAPTPATKIEVSKSSEEFVITLFVDKDVYAKDEQIVCYAELEYLGSEAIIVYSGNPLLAFGVKDDKYFDGGFMINDSLEYTEFEPGETKRFEFSKSGGYTSEDPLVEFYEAYYAQSEFVLPSGSYEISANVDYSTDANDMLGSRKSISVTAIVVVE